PKEITALVFLPDSKTLVSADEDSTLKLWNAATGKEIRTIPNDGPQLEGIPFLTAPPDGKQVIAWLAKSEIGTFTVADGKLTASRDLGDRSNIKCLTISADGVTTAVGHTDGVVRLWDIAAKQKERLGEDLKAHEKEIMDLALTPDKKTLVTADKNGVVKVWDLARREALHTIIAHKQKITAVAMSPDGARFATTGADNIVKLWDRATGKELRQWDLHMPVLTGNGELRAFVNTLAFTPDGKHLATGNTDATLYLLDCP
ncbi:MAG TPA: WD40 repeat domain-containing protein, partial [Gemmataceae bacterium]